MYLFSWLFSWKRRLKPSNASQDEEKEGAEDGAVNWNEREVLFWVIPNGELVPQYCDTVGLPIKSFLWLSILLKIKICHIPHTVVFIVFPRPLSPGFVKWQLCTSSSKTRESKVHCWRTCSWREFIQKQNTLITGSSFPTSRPRDGQWDHS